VHRGGLLNGSAKRLASLIHTIEWRLGLKLTSAARRITGCGNFCTQLLLAVTSPDLGSGPRDCCDLRILCGVSFKESPKAVPSVPLAGS
jgi:hypothetical protein